MTFATSSLYTFEGRHDWFDDYNAAGAIEDIIDTDDGYLAVGYLDDHSLIQFLDSDYKLIKEVEQTFTYDFVKVYTCGNNYCTIGASLDGMGYLGVVFNKDGNVLKNEILYTQWWITKEKTFIYEYNDYLYIFDTSVNNVISGIDNDLVVKANKYDFTDQGWYQYSSLSSDEQTNLKDYFTIVDQYMIDDKGDQAGPLFIHEYKDGFIYGLFDYVNGSNGYVYYYANNGQVWEKIYEGNHISDAIPFNDGILVWDTPNLSYESKLYYCDEEGNITETDIVDEYFADVENYAIALSYKMIPLEKGFALTSEYHYEVYGSRPIGPDDGSYSVLFFSKKYHIITKSDNNGTITVSKSLANSGEIITFTAIPNEGYVLKVVKVTDSDGNVVTFTSNTFTMPSADVTIEATFVVDNPNTKSVVIVSLMVIGILSGILFILYKKKIRFLK